MAQGPKRRTRERVLVICALVLWACFAFRISDFGFMQEPDGDACAQATGPSLSGGCAMRDLVHNLIAYEIELQPP